MEIAYHFVLSNGSTDVELGHLEPTWRYRLGLWSTATRSWANLTALHVCIVGNYEETDFPKALEGPAGHAIRTLQEKYGIPDDRILLHRDCGQTACPGKNVTRERILAWTRKASDCPPEVRAQQLRAIGQGHRVAWLVSALLLAGFVWARGPRPAEQADGESAPRGDSTRLERIASSEREIRQMCHPHHSW